MENYTTASDLKTYLGRQNERQISIGFVPTMGALHAGHLSLLERAKTENDLVICSIFVNPTQFNDPSDLEKYPRPIEQDIWLLKKVGCDVLFKPAVDEMYAQNEHWELDLNGLDKVFEGAYRPGHFAGVTQIVHKLLNIIGPCKAYFGQKDYQQFRIIQYMIQELGMPNVLVRCPILREADGLAMSSRNIHLSGADRKNARVLSKAIFWLRDHISEFNALKKAQEIIADREGVVLDYLELINGETLQPVLATKINTLSAEIVVVVAAKVGHTRLIDNCIVKPASCQT